ncbi:MULTISPECIES: energy transducer TonB [Croceitalea]|uniref:Energy transducer TonB n=1 Tax=Croceitalea vernalis TaxID=3075599 RepID=A0ABU3BJY3_9FLAO|nr:MULTISPECIES: energy transducer TonB [unclassified Croceitalea]MDT0540621.1 energy transducer TonB [Croceitalea sp. P059]MDT0622477.1 energy transducer TonB [Croceitalea sp. P007]
MSFLDTRHKKKSFTLTTLLLSVLLLLLFYIGLTYLDPPEESGIAVNFGTMEFGSGEQQPQEKIKSEPLDIPEPPAEAEQIQEEVEEEVEEVVDEVVKEQPTEKVLTQESEESIRIRQQKEAKRKADAEAAKVKAEAQRKAQERRDAEERLKKEQEAKKKKLDAMMGGIGKSDGTASGSEGNDDKAGDKGQPDGNPYATTYYGAPGSGTGTGGYGLSGRSLVTKGKVQQECNEDGRVVVKIIVDRNGKVIKATPGVKGTTNSAPCLLEPARKTAFMHKWNLDSNAPSQQIGFVVVNFKLGQ